MKKNLIAGAVCAALLSSTVPAMASEAELLQKLEKLAAELDSIKAELAATRKKTDSVEQKQAAQASAVAPAAAALGANTVISSYGEIAYSQPKNASNQAQTDVARAVLGITHRFSDKTKMVGEFEWEHAVVSKDDNGEAEVEQLYVEHEIQPGLAAKAGLFLMPVGLLNTAHEPTAYHGVQRNFVETAIIPSTWREVGFGLSGNHDNGVSWDLGLTTGFDLSKWNAAEAEGKEAPLRSIHQEGQLAKSKDLSLHAAVNWRGVPGLLLGGSVFSGKAGHSTDGFAANDARITLWDLHARYNPGRLDLTALYTRGTISNTAVFNAVAATQPEFASPMPSSFYGWYAQAAYQAWKTDDYSLTPFLRYEQFNTANSYAGIAQGLAPESGTEKVGTVGASFKVGEGVVLKADFQKFKQDSSRDRYNLGVGYSF